MADAAPGLRPRPISPQIQLNGGVWRWHLTMFASIMHRATGLALFVGALVLMAWALSLASGPDAYAVFTGLAGSILGKLVLVGLTLCAFYHLANGIRHLAWDAGYGFAPKTATNTAWLVICFSIVATALFWGFLLMTGAI
ncbi:MAG TPA: succinate dehydrogenase, cytochrome b556 subunit [Caulobacteraceae bacterium]|jgi:succinate dehydrogenase / fumarate reductase cytochrome b subunit|nr:succinate dehydrogenase, cytochrome b556 subunit [Caulobacteraceae bacterium]